MKTTLAVRLYVSTLNDCVYEDLNYNFLVTWRAFQFSEYCIRKYLVWCVLYYVGSLVHNDSKFSTRFKEQVLEVRTDSKFTHTLMSQRILVYYVTA